MVVALKVTRYFDATADVNAYVLYQRVFQVHSSSRFYLSAVIFGLPRKVLRHSYSQSIVSAQPSSGQIVFESRQCEESARELRVHKSTYLRSQPVDDIMFPNVIASYSNHPVRRHRLHGIDVLL